MTVVELLYFPPSANPDTPRFVMVGRRIYHPPPEMDPQTPLVMLSTEDPTSSLDGCYISTPEALRVALGLLTHATHWLAESHPTQGVTFYHLDGRPTYLERSIDE